MALSLIGTQILGLAETQIGHVDIGEDDRKRLLPKTVATKNFGSLDNDEEESEDVDGGNKEIDIPAPVLAADFYPKYYVINGYQRFPWLDTGFLENKAETHEGEDNVG